MLAVVNRPPIRIEAPVIPRKLVSFLQINYGNVEIIRSSDFVASDPDNISMRVSDMDWYKKAVAKMTPGGNLKLLRKSRNLTQRDLALKSGITAVAISDMERGRISIVRKSAQKLAEALGTSVGNLFFKKHQ